MSWVEPTSRLAGTIKASAEVIRLGTALKAAAFTLVGVYLSSDLSGLLSRPALAAALVVGLIVAASFAANDYRDAPGDRFNHWTRPIPSGRLARTSAAGLSLLLALAGVAISWTLGPAMAVIALATVVLSAAYSLRLKNTLLLGNGTVALLDAMVVPYGGLAVGTPAPAIWIVAVLTFFYIIAQEVLYTVGDHSGDALAGFRTTATRLGPRAALRIVRALALAFVAATIIVWFLGLAPDRYLYAALPCSILPVAGVVVVLTFWPTSANVRRSGQLLKLAQLAGLIPILMLK